MSVSRMLRSMVSKDSNRFKEGEFDLDLTYITDRIISMGFPASGMEGMYRNHILEVANFLKQRHNGQYMIWNLSGRPYDYSMFDNQVLDFGFPDHHSPPLLLLIETVLSIHKWLSSSPENVSVIHCLAGKGRTGTVVACYLLYAGYFSSSREALQLYASKRSEINKGVSYPSQLRYVEYFRRVCFDIKRYYPRYLKMKSIRMGPLMRTRPILEVYRYQSSKATEEGLCVTEDLIYSAEAPLAPLEETEFLFNINQIIEGDIVIRCYYTNWYMSKVMFLRSCFNTLMVTDNSYTLKKEDLDLAEKDPKFPKEFTLTIEFSDDFEPPANEFDYSLYSQFFLEARECDKPVHNNHNNTNSDVDLSHKNEDEGDEIVASNPNVRNNTNSNPNLNNNNNIDSEIDNTFDFGNQSSSNPFLMQYDDKCDEGIELDNFNK